MAFLRRYRFPPALALWFIAPIFGELISGSAPLNEYLSVFTILVFGMLYGSGVLLVREAVIRWRKGWPALLLLGAAYGVYEEGLIVRSFFDPHWMDLGVLGEYGRAVGVNWLWSLHLIVYHTVVSVAASIAFVEMLYPKERSLPWIHDKTLLFINGVLLAAMLPIGALLNPYPVGVPMFVAAAGIVIALILAARNLPQIKRPPHRHLVPRPRYFLIVSAAAAFIHNILVYAPAEHKIWPAWMTMVVVLIFDGMVLSAIMWMSNNAEDWDDRHRFAAVCGVLGLYVILGPVTTDGQYPVMYFTSPVFTVAAFLFYRRLEKRYAAPSTG